MIDSKTNHLRRVNSMEDDKFFEAYDLVRESVEKRVARGEVLMFDGKNVWDYTDSPLAKDRTTVSLK